MVIPELRCRIFLPARSSPRELRRRFGRRPIGPEVTVPKDLRHTRQIRDSLIEAIRRKADAIIWLSHTYDWQFFLASIYEVHRAGHNLWPVDRTFSSAVDPDAMLDVYIEADRQIARIIDALDLETTEIVLFSLNGMTINRAQDHFLDRIMRRLNAVYLNEPMPNGPSDPDPNLLSFLRRIVPPKLQYLAVKLLGENVQDWVVNRSLVGRVDWQITPAFRVLSGGEGYIRFNIKGRERDGYFDPGSPELARYSDWLKKRLMRITVGDSGSPLISDIVEFAERFPGPKQKFLPDLALTWNPEESAETIRSDDIGVLHGRMATGRGGNHAPDSFSVFFGGRANPEASAHVNHIADLGVYARDWARSLQ